MLRLLLCKDIIILIPVCVVFTKEKVASSHFTVIAKLCFTLDYIILQIGGHTPNKAISEEVLKSRGVLDKTATKYFHPSRNIVLF